MPKKEYNSFYGGIAGDDYIATPNQYLYAENIDSNRLGYGVTLGPKVINKFTSKGPLFSMSQPSSTNEGNKFLAGNNGVDEGYIYNINSTDVNTPSLTVKSTETHFFLLEKVIRFNGDFFFTGRRGTGTGSNDTEIHHSDGGIGSGFPVSYDRLSSSSITNFDSYSVSPHVEFDGSLYIGGFGAVIKITPTGLSYTYTKFSFLGMLDIVSMNVHNTIIYLYDRLGNIRYWKGQDSVTEGQNKYSFCIQRAETQGGYDLAVTNEGDMVFVGGSDATDISNPRKSYLGEDFGTLFSIKDFSIDDLSTVGDTIKSTRSDNYIVGEGKHIYKFNKLMPGITPSFSNIVTKNNAGTDIDKIYHLEYDSHNRRVYFSYKAGDYYGVDYIDLTSYNTCSTGTMYFNIHRGVPNQKNSLISHTITTSFTNGNKSVKVYIRVNNKSWELVKNINELTNVINKSKNESIKNNFIDNQIKVVFTNTDKDNMPPILHSVLQNYKVIEE